MKIKFKSFVMLFVLLFTFGMKAQVGIGTNVPDSSAQLEVLSTSKGMLVPRMSLAQRNTINSPANGLLIYQTNSFPGFYYCNNGQWQRLVSSVELAVGGIGTGGNTILNGIGYPLQTIGTDGDFYLNTSTTILFGPKSGGFWPVNGTALVGPKGDPGSNTTPNLSFDSAYNLSIKDGNSVSLSSLNQSLSLTGPILSLSGPRNSQVDFSALMGSGGNVLHDGTLTGNGTASMPLSISNTTVIPGVYKAADVTIDSSGRITAAANGATNVAVDASALTKGLVQLAGDLGGTAVSPTVSTVGGVPAAQIIAGVTLANAATTLNTPNTIVKRDAAGNFTAGTITGNLTGNATTAGSVTGTILVPNGGTGITSYVPGNFTSALNATTLQQRTPAQVKTDIGLSDVENTSDADKPVSTATQNALNLKEDKANKSTDGTFATDSDNKYPTEKATRTYVDAKVNAAISTAGVPDATTVTMGKIQLAGDLSGIASAPTVPGLLLKEPLIINLPVDKGGTGITSYTAGNFISAAATTTLQQRTPAQVKEDLGLNLVSNTNDAKKPVSTATQTALDTKIDKTAMAAVNGVATLDATGKIPTGQIPAISFSSVDVVNSEVDMLAFPSPLVGSTVIRTDQSKSYVLAAIPGSILANWKEILTPGSGVHTVNGQTGIVALTKADIGLSDVDNTSDVDKPVSTATQTELDLKEDKTNKSIDVAADAAFDSKYPSVKAVKTYVDAQVSAASAVPDATAIITGKIKLAGDLGGTAALPTVLTLGGAAATSAATPNTIVKRDASGNFAAATITGNLTGNATTVTTNANLTGDVTSVGNATTIGNSKVTYAKMQAMTVNKLLGSGLAGTAVSEITLGTGLSFTGTTLNATGGSGANLAYTPSASDGLITSDTGNDATIPAGSTTNASLMLPADKIKLNAISGTNTGDQINITGNAATVTTNANLTGDVTSVGNATTIGNSKVTYVKMQAMTANKLLGSGLAGTAVSEITLGTGLSFTGSTLNVAGGSGDALTTNPLSQFAATTSAQLAGVLSNETGTGSAVFATSPTLVTPNLGTPSTLVGTNITGTAAGLTAGTVTTNATLTGDVTSVGNATTIGNSKVTYAKMQAMTVNKLLGSGLAGTAVSEITLGTGLSFTGTTLNATGGGAGANLTYTPAAAQGTVASDTGADAIIPSVSATNAGLMIPADKTKFDKIADIAGVADANKVLTVNAGGTAATWATPAAGGGGLITYNPSGNPNFFARATGLGVTAVWTNPHTLTVTVPVGVDLDYFKVSTNYAAMGSQNIFMLILVDVAARWNNNVNDVVIPTVNMLNNAVLTPNIVIPIYSMNAGFNWTIKNYGAGSIAIETTNMNNFMGTNGVQFVVRP